mmetsp:Transcript_1608/g.1926  ORF Transcript_1608/g.1926 Transcript_1608/m.1926 type:complete len:251 (-) Transcript_1608:215-967(-)|eukprot:CAMPEP_0203672340 /NCGR_PEP_ID=MMETSP0090-20130426/8218_1 /ASSEMBLY_ACC=CAM_ASM_001088 /TAXON_ID=426623 /ORGANISM="Chaetoceros affinis, Strain CCMP159" /LENGTH=250 /DNA_ID=CAMNT_0050537643 /DNA_START=138 /DNA_END=890 /DNA_ORIENTATION=+
MAAPSHFQWKQCVELGYADGQDSNDDMADPVCFKCGKSSPSSPDATSLSRCSKCHVATYCSRDCQVAHWKKGPGGGHKFSCSAYKRVGSDMIIIFPDDKESARQDLFQRIRFYACPYFVWKSESKCERGFLFIQSDSTLAEMSLPLPILGNGRPMTKTRSVLMDFLTISEYDKELCRDDFELATVRKSLNTAVQEYDQSEEIVVLMRFRCGHVSAGVTKLVPDHGLCKTLGKEYYANAPSQAVQLNLDDM